MNDGLELLTDGQRDCLRLVLQGKTSKEIALELGISRYTVDQRLDRARVALGAASRREAAQIFAGATAYERFVYDPQPIAQHQQPDASQGTGPQERSSSGEALQEAQAVYSATMPAQTPAFRIPRIGERRSDLSIRARLTWIGVMAFAIVMIMSALVAVAWGGARILGPLL